QLRIHGQDEPVRAELVKRQSASAHADADQLLAWLAKLPQAPDNVFVVHGDAEASDQLRHRIHCELKWPVTTPEHGATWPV
ncbi:MAG: MBL fold metallo-hydrolase RNA specificity domain-containing protein, partial [Burkholderiaceae bacterium]|nr:MBL fold metallo-hydrolase RNA specificity domain-containing protein [Burkholderiaceae bacterium]